MSDPDIGRAEHHSPRREGKFEDLKSFCDVHEEVLLKLGHYQTAIQANLRPGNIIHVNDNKTSRIDKRILFVKAMHVGAPSMICYSFCKHEPALSSADAATHWQVVPAGAINSASDRSPASLQPNWPALEVDLHYNLRPQVGITINLRDPWNVEYEEVQVCNLGRVTDTALKPVLYRINEIFVSEPPAPPTNIVPEGSPTSEQMKRTRSAGAEQQENAKHSRVPADESTVPKADRKHRRSSNDTKHYVFRR